MTQGSPKFQVVLEVMGINTSGWMQLAQECAQLAGKERPTLLVPVSQEARHEIARALYSRASDTAEVGVPCDGSLLTVTVDPEVRDADALLRPEAPMFETAKGRSAIRFIAGSLAFSGITCTVAEPDDSMLYTVVHYATGETGREQVLGWDDIYGDDYSCAKERVEIQIVVQGHVLADPHKRRDLAKVLMLSRPAFFESVGLDDGEDGHLGS
ncbi:hypothetical protein [Ornithinimicrobium cryptoxanthini]|uniref:hypothetical protein n=1 Tax=Ornithinimicrobium cryptoxanthini TaxID=2934161 RepID=UPI002118E1EC|nr:hypothetical protein [Ornithinimicrobium cryptoxanthini]